MSQTNARYPHSTDLTVLETEVEALQADGYQAVGAAVWNGQVWTQTMVKGTTVGTFEDLASRMDDAETAITAAQSAADAAQSAADDAQTTADGAVTVNGTQATSITNLNTWANVLATKLNADGGVTDTNYDTNPQA
jgi:hypothetical protein